MMFSCKVMDFTGKRVEPKIMCKFDLVTRIHETFYFINIGPNNITSVDLTKNLIAMRFDNMKQ